MTVPLTSTRYAGRIRDATRVAVIGETLAVIGIVGSFVVPQVYLLAPIGPVALGVLMLALLELLGSTRFVLGLVVTFVGAAGVSLEFAATLSAIINATYRVDAMFGAGTVLVGGWFVGLGLIAHSARLLAQPVPMKAIESGIGLALLGFSWFLDGELSLLLVLVSLFFFSGLGPVIKALSEFGLPPKPVAAPVPSPGSTPS